MALPWPALPICVVGFLTICDVFWATPRESPTSLFPSLVTPCQQFFSLWLDVPLRSPPPLNTLTQPPHPRLSYTSTSPSHPRPLPTNPRYTALSRWSAPRRPGSPSPSERAAAPPWRPRGARAARPTRPRCRTQVPSRG